ncbi:MAG: FAD-dependent oxidoreductase [Pseudomonadota bacterium]
MPTLNLAYNIQFKELYCNNSLKKIDNEFIGFIKNHDIALYNKLMAARAHPESLDIKDESNFLLELAPYLEDFLGKLFNIEQDVTNLQNQHNDLAILYKVKRLFIQRKALKLAKVKEANNYNGEELITALELLFNEKFDQYSYARHIDKWLRNEEENENNLILAAKYAIWAANTEAGKHKHSDKNDILFHKPQKLDFARLVPVETEVINGVTVQKLPNDELRYRYGFSLTDEGFGMTKTLDQANYCIYCHNQGKDSCSKGLFEKDGETFKSSPTKVTLNGCPLEEKISEMNKLKADGYSIAALAMVIVDNPMCAATGYRICNDCMKSCIYQKQEPVDIPLIESHNLRDVLSLPWGFEIYSLLTRWNPLNIRRPLPRPETNKKVLIAGLGPAGFTLAHHLINDGHVVVAVDGLKIEPLPKDISGIDQMGNRHEFKPINNVYEEIYEELDKRTLSGFGGVAEYGITIRWDKNFLKIIRLLIERRDNFRMYGGIRFGSNITYEQAFQMGFDHIALAIGAGKPNILDVPNGLCRGVRTASDFLMSLQLTGAGKFDSLANLQIRLPIMVIGGGLTGVDTTTESLAYYSVQVEKFLKRYEVLVKNFGEEQVTKNWTKEEHEIANEFITHAKLIRAEKEQAIIEHREADIISLLKIWGGATLAYRRNLIDSPSYRLNHEEVEKALEEGIYFLENATPLEFITDDYGHVKSIKLSIKETRDGVETVEEKILPAKTILVATGTNPNTILNSEEGEQFKLDGKYFQAINTNREKVEPEWSAKPKNHTFLINKTDDNRYVSFFGDLHPSYAGNVVKAMGSAKHGYPIITEILSKENTYLDTTQDEFFSKMDQNLIATVHDVIKLTPNIVEVIVKAPLAARNFHPGQFYRLQNYEANSYKINDTTLAMEGLALTGASIDHENGLMSTIVLEMGGSSNLCALLKKDEPVILMGPTGEPTETPPGEKVLLIGGGLGNAVLFSIGKALRQANSEILYFAGYKKSIDRYKVKEIEDAADQIIWCCDESLFEPEREGDASFHGNIVSAMLSYAKNELDIEQKISLSDIDRIICIGSDRMMKAVAIAKNTILKPYLKSEHVAISSINSPMQCMMKEICAQCLQKHIDPVTGKETYVYSCANQDQCMDSVDFSHLNERLQQNSLQEKLTTLWLKKCTDELNNIQPNI